MTMADAKQTLSNRLAKLHRRMEEAQVDAYLVLSSDAHLNEYVPEYTRRQDGHHRVPGLRRRRLGLPGWEPSVRGLPLPHSGGRRGRPR